jgi:hypothetical protein
MVGGEFKTRSGEARRWRDCRSDRTVKGRDWSGGCDAATWEGATQYQQALAKAQVHPSADGKGSFLTSRVQFFVRMMLRTNGDAELRMIDPVTGLQFSNPGYNFSNGDGDFGFAR